MLFEHGFLEYGNDSAKQGHRNLSLCKSSGFHFICYIPIIYKSGGALYGTRPFRIHRRSALFPYSCLEALRPDAVCGSLAHPAVLSSRLGGLPIGSHLGTHIPRGCQGLPTPRSSCCADAPADSLSAHLDCRSWLLDLHLLHPRLLVLAVGRLSCHAAAPVGSPLHPTTMASCLVSAGLLHLSRAGMVCPALHVVSDAL